MKYFLQLCGLICLLCGVFTTSVLACDAQGILTDPTSKKLLIHNLGRDFLGSKFLTKLHKIVIEDHGYTGPRSGYSNPNLVFIRDYSPVLINRGDRTIVLTYRAPLLKGAPSRGQALTVAGREIRDVPLILEGGNVISTDRHLILSDKVFKENPSRSPQEIVNILSKATDTEPQNVLVLEWMPGERTGHVDEYIGELSSNTLAIPYIPEAMISELGFAHERMFAQHLNQWLNARETELLSHGIEIVRIAMLPPQNLIPSKLSPTGWDAQFPSPVNWAREGDNIFIPLFENTSERYVEDTKNLIKSRGLTPIFIESQSLLKTYGLLHCMTANY